ncbi:protein of unknown function [Candidatus Hydrogenisulfobacillus filiaventi]|uniref:Uncharacterized protein n=1 Tax=Candidatus Hydrogenisulfobacillus filiaventi TaxID=2707344 RepID=A0A6F8ZHV0_9FIRM|nr:protein of unknown function [Candidatus Hydrogenisulfobacillus filiaventi]
MWENSPTIPMPIPTRLNRLKPLISPPNDHIIHRCCMWVISPFQPGRSAQRCWCHSPLHMQRKSPKVGAARLSLWLPSPDGSAGGEGPHRSLAQRRLSASFSVIHPATGVGRFLSQSGRPSGQETGFRAENPHSGGVV